MFLIANLGFGLQLAYSAPVALSKTLYEKLGISEEKYGFFFTVYSLPNLFMILIGGVLIDILGTGIISVIFCGIAAFSSILTAVAVPHFDIMLMGRFLLGMGGETLLACATTMIPLFYSPSEVPLCMGFLASWFYWGNLTALLVLPEINKIWGLNAALWFVAAVFILEFILNLLLIHYRDRLRWTDQNELKTVGSSTMLKSVSSGSMGMADEEREFEEQQDESPTISVNGDDDIHKNMTKWEEFIDKLSQVKYMLRKLSGRFWLLSVICFVSFYSMFGLAIIGTDVLETKFGYDEQKAAMIMASEAIINGIMPMFTGLLILRVRGRKIQIMIVACALLALGTLLLNITDVYPLPWIILCGMGFAMLNTTLMSCVPLMVEMSIVGTAYGIICTSYNLNIFLFPPILDTIKHRTGSYKIPLAILTFSALLAIVLLVILKMMDMKVPLSESLDSPYSTAGQDPIPDHESLKELDGANNQDDLDNIDEESSINGVLIH
eukprot:gene7858-9223_t